MKRFTKITLVVLLIMSVLSSCVNKELCYDHQHGLKLRLKLVCKTSTGVVIALPPYMKVVFYPVDGSKPNEQYLTISTEDRLNNKPQYIYVEEDFYDVVVYNWRIAADAQTVQFRGGESYSTIEAFTGLYSRGALFSKSETNNSVRLAPDSLWSWSYEGFEVSTERFVHESQASRAEGEIVEEYVIELDAEPVLRTEYYTFTVDVAGNTDAVFGCEAAVEGCKGSLMLGGGELSTDCSILGEAGYDSSAKRYTVWFSTFGFSPTAPKVIVFNTTLPDGTIQVDRRDIGSLLTSGERHIAVPIVIDYSKPIHEGGGGFTPPVVGDWEQKFEDINM